ncbi:MAG: penicillin-binding transpeptidase domain-containing protein, partial [Bacteroidota bacterium]
GERQYVHKVEDLYDRVSIYFTTRDGERIDAATIQNGHVLSVDPSNVSDADMLYQALQSYIDLDQETFIHRATLPERTYVPIDYEILSQDAEAIEALNLSGVHLYKNRWRYYPGAALSARAVGFVGYGGENADELSGRYGLERYYEEVLARDRESLSVNFFAEIFSNLGNLAFDTASYRQGDVITSIEPTVARVLQNELLETTEKFDSTLTAGIIINPKTGEIYALDAVPTFDLNERSNATVEDFRNPLVENVYEFGSIIKALTMAAGLDSGAVTTNTTYYDSGQLELDTFTIGNFDGKGRGTVDMQEVLSQSLNTGGAFIVDTMGKVAFREYFIALKLGSEAGIDLPNEAHGLVDNLDSPRDIEYATASFGQGIALTPIAASRALSSLGNGGALITPHIATAIH